MFSQGSSSADSPARFQCIPRRDVFPTVATRSWSIHFRTNGRSAVDRTFEVNQAREIGRLGNALNFYGPSLGQDQYAESPPAESSAAATSSSRIENAIGRQ